MHRFPEERPHKTTWNNYYEHTIISQEYLQQKEVIFRQFCEGLNVQTVLDAGANDGYFSKILASRGLQVIATDVDGQCINRLYQEIKKKGIPNILPLILDISNPTPAIGFHNRERAAFHERIKVDLVIALALIHHLAIGRNIPFPMLADYLQDTAPELIIEFVPKEDEKVKQMLASRADIFQDYTVAHFEEAFSIHFDILKKAPVPHTARTLYHMKRKRS